MFSKGEAIPVPRLLIFQTQEDGYQHSFPRDRVKTQAWPTVEGHDIRAMPHRTVRNGPLMAPLNNITLSTLVKCWASLPPAEVGYSPSFHMRKAWTPTWCIPKPLANIKMPASL